MRIFLLTCFIVLFAVSCKKENIDDPNCEFIEGDVAVGIDSSLQLEQLFLHINALNLRIDQVNGFFYTTSIPKDSIPYIKSVLSAKPYITTRGFTASVWPHFQTDIVHNTTMLWDMDGANQQDYIQTKNALRMIDKRGATKSVLLKVPVGQEVFWKNELRKYPWVRWTELNRIVRLELHGG